MDDEDEDDDEITKLFESHNIEYLQHQNIRPERRMHRRPDLNAFLLLDRMVPGDHDMVDGADHDEIWLNVDAAELVEVASEEDILDLIRCGVRYDAGFRSLCMFM